MVRLTATPPAGPPAAPPAPPPAGPATGEPASVGPDHPAYVMFTSGSTGHPKAVVVRHGGLSNYVAAALRRYRLTRQDRVLQFTALGFDVSAEEIFPCLAAGAALVLRSEEMLDSPADFLAGCDRLQVTVAHLPTAYFHELATALEAGAAKPPGAMRVVAIGGEAPVMARVAGWHAAAPQVRVENVYGPTEATIATTMATLVAPGVPLAGPVSIGSPLPGTGAYLLDAELEPVLDGAVGQLYVGGAGLATGYLGDPARTADRFVPHPFRRGERVYRTGDLARVLPGGELEFRGRVDDQVKIRGYRVEPGEVSAVLAGIAGVGDAVVMPRPGPHGELELVGYVVPADPDQPPAMAGLRTALAARLPGYLVPRTIVSLPRLPLTANDKVDRAALPDPWAGPGGPTAPERPRALTPTEQAVAAVWREVLGVARVDADADFFALGGHSLLANRVVSRLRRQFGAGARVHLLLAHPSLSAFAAALEHAASAPVRQLGRADAAAGLAAVAELAPGLSERELAALLRHPGGSPADLTEA